MITHTRKCSFWKSMLILVIVLIPFQTVFASDGVKWHPGHYYATMGHGKNNPAYMRNVYAELEQTRALRGLQVRYAWAELEASEGVYNFAPIDTILNELAKRGKRLFILIQTKSFNLNFKSVPDYLKAEKYENGTYIFVTYGEKKPKGENIKLWNPLVRDRLIALFRALGERYNAHPYFEGIGLPETALGEPLAKFTTTETDQFFANLLAVHQAMRQSFPNTVTLQSVNHPRSILKSFTDRMKTIGTALSGPDIFLEDPAMNAPETKNTSKGIYHYYPELSGIVPIAPSVMQSNYAMTQHNKETREPSIHELLSFAKNNLKANYIIWTREPKYFSRLLQVLNEPDQTREPSGGLIATCPKAFRSCKN